MPGKTFVLDDELTVVIYKRRGNRNLHLSITANGQTRISIPAWAPYKVGVDFARSRRDWILQNNSSSTLLTNGQAIGKAHHLKLEASASVRTVTSRVSQTTIVIRYPLGLQSSDAKVQRAANDACIRALRQQAEKLLPQRLAELAARYDFSYQKVSIKLLKRRWGSCDQHKNIVLNLFLMQLPWNLIDYVLLHELTHTVVLRHGLDFWQAMESVLPDSKPLRRQLRDYQPQPGRLLTK